MLTDSAAAPECSAPAQSERSGQRRRQIGALVGSTGVQAVCNGAAALVSTRALGAHDRGLVVIGVTIAGVTALIGGFGTGSAYRSCLPSRQTP